MAINVDVQDLENFPGNVKRVTIDQVSVIPQGSEGDEKYLFKFSTTAYSDITARTAIQDYYVTDLKTGWARSSGFAGNSGQFSLTAAANRIMVMIDSTVSGTSNGYYEITLDYNADTTPMSGVSIAEDIETKIRAISLDTADAGFALAYKNASVEYKDGKFWIVSGSVSKFYTGNNRSFVDVISGSTHDALAVLGFDLGINSATLATASINEALVTSGYTTGNSGITIDQNIGASEGDCLLITDREHSNYFQLDSTPIGGVALTFSSTAITNNYIASEAKVQLLREQDPEAGPSAWFEDIDKITRHGIKTMINSIDFSE
jgi:hypothetical protein